MKVFISWSGVQSKHIAAGLNELLPQVIQAVVPFMSSANIEAGTRWASRLNTELSSTDFGVICLTPENTLTPWLLYEAGALSKSLDKGRVCPLLYNLTFDDVDWPLAQFQLKNSDRAGLTEIVDSINSSMGEKQLDQGTLSKTFDRIWPEFEDMLAKVPELESSEHPKERSDRAVLNEILSLVRNNESELNIRRRVGPDQSTLALHCLKTLDSVEKILSENSLELWAKHDVDGTLKDIVGMLRVLRASTPVGDFSWIRLGDSIEALETYDKTDLADLVPALDSLRANLTEMVIF